VRIEPDPPTSALIGYSSLRDGWASFEIVRTLMGRTIRDHPYTS